MINDVKVINNVIVTVIVVLIRVGNYNKIEDSIKRNLSLVESQGLAG